MRHVLFITLIGQMPDSLFVLHSALVIDGRSFVD